MVHIKVGMQVHIKDYFQLDHHGFTGRTGRACAKGIETF